MSLNMTATQIPANLCEAITLPIEILGEVLKGKVQTSMRLTRANIAVLQRVFDSRSANNFDYEEFTVEDIPELQQISGADSEVDDDDIVIMMNDYIPSPVYHHEFYVTTPESSNSDSLSNEIDRIQSNDSSRASISEDEYMANLADFCTNILKKNIDEF
jgi:hypothetical protein